MHPAAFSCNGEISNRGRVGRAKADAIPPAEHSDSCAPRARIRAKIQPVHLRLNDSTRQPDASTRGQRLRVAVHKAFTLPMLQRNRREGVPTIFVFLCSASHEAPEHEGQPQGPNGPAVALQQGAEYSWSQPELSQRSLPPPQPVCCALHHRLLLKAMPPTSPPPSRRFLPTVLWEPRIPNSAPCSPTGNRWKSATPVVFPSPRASPSTASG